MYDQYFGFRESPFSVTPDPNFFYENPVYLEAYASLRYGVAAKKGFIAITGEVGTGKTTLLRKLMHDFDKSVHFATIFNTLLNFDELLWVTLCDLGVPTERKDRLVMLNDLNTHLVEQFKKAHTVCLLIDEAQNLTDETLEGLRLLSNLETNKQKLLQIVLIGQPELNAKLDKPELRQLKQRIAIQCKIVPLTEEEVGSYIDFRLKVANYHGNDLFETEAVKKIAAYSKGIPRLINILCDNALLIAFAASQTQVAARMVDEAAGDLRLGTEGAQPTVAEKPVVPSGAAEKPLVRSLANRREDKVRRAFGSAIGALIVIAAFATGFFLSGRVSFFVDQVKPKDPRSQNVSVPPRPPVIAQKVEQDTGVAEPAKSAPPAIQWRDRVFIQYGSTVYEIALDAYGANAILGLDLIKEFNPQIPNLNWVAAGQELLLPPLTRETLIRQQADGSYRVVVTSVPTRAQVQEVAGRVGRAGYRVAIIARRVSNDILLYRLEIDGLTNLEDAQRAFEAGSTNGWYTFAATSPGAAPESSQSEVKY
jgi:general secretion pathway protein A